MSTQYDTIGTTYAGMKRLPAGLLEAHNLRKHCAAYIKDAAVLDLACGTGHYSRLALQWGAKSVHGVDISPVMVEAARRTTASSTPPTKKATKSNTTKRSVTKRSRNRTTTSTTDDTPTDLDLQITFSVADCTIPAPLGSVHSATYNLILGSWVLNYAPTLTAMTMMFRTAHLNLRPNGHFICIVPHPSPNPREHMTAALAARPPTTPLTEAKGKAVQGKYWITMSPTRDVEDGVATRIEAQTETGFVQFEAFHLRKAVFEMAAREGGFVGGVSWRRVSLPEEGGWEGDWRGSFVECPHFGVLVVRKEG